MINNNYENINDEIDEEFLDENIPRDLYLIYNRQPYPSQRNPETEHSELWYGNRRSKKYDYGKAEYRIISANEAIQMVKNNKNEAQNLRIIFDGDLVEYEVRDNGSIYAIYRSSDAVTINGKTYKNVGYAPWQQVVQAADKIYWTDEYSRKLSPEEIDKRNKKQAERIIYKGLRPGDYGYDPHKPHKNLTHLAIRKKAVPDTGEHKKADARINTLYIAYDLARKALKRLDADKDIYDEDEYAEIKAKLEANKKEALDKYNEQMVIERIKETQKIKEISVDTHNFNQKLEEYTRMIEKALTDGYDLKKRFDALLVTTANTGVIASSTLAKLRQSLVSVITSLKADMQAVEGAEKESKDADSKRIESLLKEIAEYKAAKVSEHLRALLEVENKIKEVEEIFAVYRPNAAAKKARMVAAQTKEMPAELLNVVEFTNF